MGTELKYGNCNECQAWDGYYETENAECRRHPPTIKNEEEDSSRPFTYPITRGYQGCWDHIKREE
jgi:hypothetical protein